jgi:hypothetical protein
VRGIVRNGLRPAPSKSLVSLRVDQDVLEWFRSQGSGCQTRINTVPRAFRDASIRQSLLDASSTRNVATMKVLNCIAATALVFATSSGATTPSPYVGQESREIRSLSRSDVADLLAGKGIGYAKAAELNGYPGPAHVLEMASKLGLSPEQRARTQAVFERMQASAKDLGAQLVEAERALDASFRNHDVTPESLTQAIGRVAEIDGKLRNVHLSAHLEQTRILAPEQVALYAKLRGYASDKGDRQGHHQGHK